MPHLRGERPGPRGRALSPIFLILAILDGLLTLILFVVAIDAGADALAVLYYLLVGGTGTVILLGLSQGVLVLLEILERVRAGSPPTPGTA